MPPTEYVIHSPYDPEARFSQKRQTEWFGYKVHMTETCDEDQPHLITHVETTSATTRTKHGSKSFKKQAPNKERHAKKNHPNL